MGLSSLLMRSVHPEVDANVERLELPWSRHGIDPYGISKEHLKVFFSTLRLLYKNYFTVHCAGLPNIPARGRTMLIGNHSGGIAVDGALILTSMLLELNPPRLAQGMAEKFINTMPVASTWTSRVGQFTGLPEHAQRLLEDDRMLMVFPEGARGTAKLYSERHSLVRFGTGFMRLALATKTRIIPVAVLGGGEAIPTVFNAYKLGKALGAPYIPVTPYLLPIPLPVRFDLLYGTPLVFEGTGSEEDEVIQRQVDLVRDRIATMIEIGKRARNENRTVTDEEVAL